MTVEAFTDLARSRIQGTLLFNPDVRHLLPLTSPAELPSNQPFWLIRGKWLEASVGGKTVHTLLVGFDSAWTATNSGAIAAVVHRDDGTFVEVGAPECADYTQAAAFVQRLQGDIVPSSTLIMLDQPTVVKNAAGQRPVENIVGSPVSLRYGGMQPANTSKLEMFGPGAPVWPFLRRFGGPADPLNPAGNTWVMETYPVLAMIALEWTLPDGRATGRLPKYNPARRKTFTAVDWQHVCQLTAAAFNDRGLTQTAAWIASVARKPSPRKEDQDRLDACLCLIVALHLSEGKECLMVGDLQTGYIVVPCSGGLCAELERRCRETHRNPSEWVRVFRKSS